MMPAVNCVVDRDVLNAETYGDLEDVGLSVFATLCGRNRGVFVLNPPDGHSYGCIEFPPDFAIRAGVHHSKGKIVDSNSINRAYINGTISSGDAVDLVDYFIQSVYFSSGIGVSTDTHACDVSGLAKLTCDNKKDLAKIRSVTLPGVFTPAPWLTKGKALTLEQAKSYYTEKDFSQMKKLGLNTVQFPVSPPMFVEAGGKKDLLASLIKMADDEDLQVILLIDTDKTTLQPPQLVDAIAKAAEFGASFSNVNGIVLPSLQYVAAVRASSTTMPIFIKAGEGDLPHFEIAEDPYLFVALDQEHISAIGDVASSDSLSDRNKMFYHEAIACGARGPIEYSACWKKLPVFTFNGFNIAIDDCIHKEAEHYRDYGQCDPERFQERITSDWWRRHRESYVARQLSSFEMGVGWSYDAWKVFEDDSDPAELDSHAKLFCLKNIAAAGLLPSLDDEKPAQLACLNGPVNDFVLGDDTLAPTAGPPPDCGNGWWNFTSEQCDYWIPPPPPTPCPTQAPIPVCEGGFWSEELQQCDSCPAVSPSNMAGAGIAGAVLALIIGYFVSKKCFNRQGYTEIPNGGNV